MDDVHYFGDDPWAPSSGHALVWEEAVYPTAAHLYYALKFTYPYFRKRVREARSAQEAKDIAGMLLRQYPAAEIAGGWGSEQKRSCMEFALRLKLEQHPELKRKLVSLGSVVFTADLANPFWGRGKKGEGQNELGKLWKKLQGELIAQEATE